MEFLVKVLYGVKVTFKNVHFRKRPESYRVKILKQRQEFRLYFVEPSACSTPAYLCVLQSQIEVANLTFCPVVSRLLSRTKRRRVRAGERRLTGRVAR